MVSKTYCDICGAEVGEKGANEVYMYRGDITVFSYDLCSRCAGELEDFFKLLRRENRESLKYSTKEARGGEKDG